MPDTALASPAVQPHGAHYIAPDAHGQNFFAIDRQFQDLLSLYMEPGLLRHVTPHFERLGELAGNRLDELAMIADRNLPVLHARDRFGRDEDRRARRVPLRRRPLRLVRHRRSARDAGSPPRAARLRRQGLRHRRDGRSGTGPMFLCRGKVFSCHSLN